MMPRITSSVAQLADITVEQKKQILASEKKRNRLYCITKESGATRGKESDVIRKGWRQEQSIR